MEEGRAKREDELKKRREEEETKKEELQRKKEEDKRRREEILEQHKIKKVHRVIYYAKYYVGGVRIIEPPGANFKTLLGRFHTFVILKLSAPLTGYEFFS